MDYRKLNDLTKRDSYPLPRIDSTLDELAGSTWFSTLDLKSGDWQVEVEEKDREKAAFSVGNGLWQYNVMAFGLCNAPATFKRLMENVLGDLRCLIYLDDIIVHASTFERELERLRLVLSHLRAPNLKLNPKKCELFRCKVMSLGHVVCAEGVSTDPDKIEAVKTWRVPRNAKEVRRFVGLCTYYRQFVRSFSDVARPLHELTEKDQSFEWTKACEESFQQLKDALVSAPVLVYPRTTEPFLLDTDASNVGVGAVLSQVHDGEEKVIAYYSHALSRPERNYCTTRRELLAVVRAIENFHPYLYGRPFTVRTEHASLQWLLTFKNPEGQMARWLEKLQTYHFCIEYRAGKGHQNADVLSRRPCFEANCTHCQRQEEKELPGDGKGSRPAYTFPVVRELHSKSAITGQEESNDEELLGSQQWTPLQLRTSQMADRSISHIVKWKDSSHRPEWPAIAHLDSTTKAYWAQWDSLALREGVLSVAKRHGSWCSLQHFVLVC